MCVLDQMTLAHISDQEALDDFLNSTGDDISNGSSLTSGPDLDTSSSESLRSQTSQAFPTNNQLFNQDAAWELDEKVASQESDEPVVQSDEEDFQLDMSLVGLPDVDTLRGSEESDSAGECSLWVT